MRGFEFVAPATLAEASAMLDTDDPTVRAFSGGTALMLMMKAGVFAPSRLVSLQSVGASHGAIEATPDGGLRIGALTSLADLERSADVAKVAPVITRAMKHLANPRVRNVARVGGALAHGDPHMDLPPILAAMRSEVSTIGPNGARGIAVEELFSGYYETILQRGELISEVNAPSQTGWISTYLKCTTRTADDWPALGVAISLRLDGDVIADARVIVSAATEKLTRVGTAEKELRGANADAATFQRVGEATAASIETIDDSRGSATYKTELTRVYVRRALEEIMQSRSST
jgi:carbon-monoxide dehydrogenase medium subunit